MNANDRNPLHWGWVVGGLTLVLTISLISLGIGPVSIPAYTIGVWLLPGFESSLELSQQDILMELRVPRILGAILVGASLATAGVAFQSLFRNPLAEPYIIGASSGAALGATIAIVLGSRFAIAGIGSVGLLALTGSIGTVAIVFAVGQLAHRSSPLTLLLSGIAISSMVNALVSLVLYLSSRDALAMTITWLMGSLADINRNSLFAASVPCAVAILFLWLLSRQLDAYSLGDISAQSLGLNIRQFRFLLVLAASLATAMSVSVAGVIGFVGLIAPQIARIFVGTRHVILIPMSAIVGAIMLLVADAIARTIVSPMELPIGIITAILGGPFFLFLLLKTSKSIRD